MREARKKAGLNQNQVAEKLGVSQASYGRWEKGVDDLPIGALPVLGRLLKLNIDWLLMGEDEQGLPAQETKSSNQEIKRLRSQVDYLLQQEDRFLRNEKKHLEIRQSLHRENEELWQRIKERDASLKKAESRLLAKSREEVVSEEQKEQLALIYDALDLGGVPELGRLLDTLTGLSNLLNNLAKEPIDKKGQKRAV